MTAPTDSRSRFPFWRIEKHGTVESTNDLLLERARGAEPEGLVICADTQTRGRGRRGSPWFSPPGKGLYFSALLRPQIDAPEAIVPITLVAGIATAEALAGAAPCAAGLKWPNDLRIGKRKVGGILCEFEPAGGAPPAVVVGVGINLGGKREDFPPEIQDKTTTIEAECGAAVSSDALLEMVLDRLRERYLLFLEEGFSAFKNRWMALCDNLGENVSVPAKGGKLTGQIAGIDATGRLILTRPDGSTFSVEAGEVQEG